MPPNNIPSSSPVQPPFTPPGSNMRPPVAPATPPPVMPRPTPPPYVPPTPTPSMPKPPVQQPPMQSSSASKKMNGGESKAIVWSLVILALAIIGYVGFKYLPSIQNMPGTSNTSKFTNENVQLIKAASATLPAGFPIDTPVEVANVISANTLAYPDRKVTLYSVDYNSAKQPEEIFASYGTYLKKGNYTVGQVIKVPNQMSYQAVSSKGSMYIVISPRTAGTLVQVSYTVQNSS